MATKNISITDEAYRRLLSRRQGKESFSQVINRLTQTHDLLAFAGVLSAESARAMERHIKTRRAEIDRQRRARRNTS